MKEIKKRIISRKSEAGAVEIFYLTPEVTGKNQDGFEELKLATKRKLITLETFQVQSKVSKEQIEDLEYLHGLEVNLSGMIQSTLENESEMQTEKLIKNIMRYAGEQHFKMSFDKIQTLFNEWFSFVPKKRIRNESDIIKILMLYSNRIASESRFGPANYIIVSAGLGARIMDTPQFVYNDPNQPQLDQGSGFVYKVGQIGTSLEVLIDPNLRYDDMTIILGKNSQESSEAIFYAYMEPEILNTEIVDEKTLMPFSLTVLRKRMAVHPTENVHLQYYSFEFTDKNHNIFTHLWEKLFKKKSNAINKKDRGNILSR
jgi:hypothetical protein